MCSVPLCINEMSNLFLYLQNIDGATLLTLSKEQIVSLTGMKVGPSLKIHDMIQALKQQVAQQGANTSTTVDTDCTLVT